MQAAKQRAPHREITKAFSESELTTAAEDLQSVVAEARVILGTARQRIAAVRTALAQYTAEQLTAEHQRLSAKLDTANAQLARLAEDGSCVTYVDELDRIKDLETQLATSNEAFETDQSEYIENYFTKLNTSFERLGSGDFSIKAVSNKTGDKRVYSLQVSFKGVRIPADRIAKTLSLSDKRSLALAIFITKLDTLQDKQRKVVVLDDPVVSFDDNRIDASCVLFKELAREYGHLVVVTHYSSVVQKMSMTRAEASYIEIYRDGTTSRLRLHDTSLLALSPHDRAYEEICVAIDAGGDAGRHRDLRPFMEEHLRTVFYKQIREVRLDKVMLRDLIDGLAIAGALSAASQTKLHDLRELFNPDHHSNVGETNPVAWRLNAQNLLELLYSDLYPPAA